MVKSNNWKTLTIAFYVFPTESSSVVVDVTGGIRLQVAGVNNMCFCGTHEMILKEVEQLKVLALDHARMNY